MGLQTGVTLFNWFATRNTIAANKFANQADNEMVNKLKDDISLNVLAAYLQILQTSLQQNIAAVQLSQTIEQLNVTRKRVNIGQLPELNAAELEAQLATDSANFITTKNNKEQNLLQLKALLALDAATPFDIAAQPFEEIPLLPLTDLEPSNI